MAPRVLLATALIALNIALAAHTARTSAQPAAPPPAATLSVERPPLHIIRVQTKSPADASVLAGGYDLLEMRDGDALFVQGTDATLARLHADGYAASIHQTLDPGALKAAFAYYGGYKTVAEHYAHLDAVAAAHPDLAQVVDYGDSWRKVNGVPNGHDLKAVCITKRRAGDCALSPETDKPRFLFIASIHSRELSPAEIAYRYIDYLADGYGSNADVTWLLDSQETWIIPLANPDGRFVVQQGGNDPYLHRKNANTVDAPCSTAPSSADYGGLHPGIDLNRNSTWKWSPPVSASNSRCSAVYRGPSVASEPEVQALETLVAHLFRDQRAQDNPELDVFADTVAAPVTTTGVFLTMHSFADQVILPWNHTTAVTAPNDAGLRMLAFRASHYNGYRTGQSGEILYSTSGSNDDYTYGQFGIPSYTFEVGPGSGACAGFTPPYSCQASFWSENLGALLYLTKAARAPYITSFGPTPVSVSASGTTSGTLLRVTFNDNALGTNGVGRPAAQAVVSAELYLDTPPWAGGIALPMSPEDGAGTSTTEAFSFLAQTGACDASRHQVFMRGIDADGNPGVLASAFVTPNAAVAPAICLLELAPHVATTETVVSISTTVSTSLPITITAAQLQIDASDFISQVITMTAADGAADSALEVFTATIDTATLATGIHTVTIRALVSSGAYTPTRSAEFVVLPVGFARVWMPVVVR